MLAVPISTEPDRRGALVFFAPKFVRKFPGRTLFKLASSVVRFGRSAGIEVTSWSERLILVRDLSSGKGRDLSTNNAVSVI